MLYEEYRRTSIIHLVLLSGGSGSRLWPLSNNSRSKQFLKVLRDSNGKPVSMVQRVFSQISNISDSIDVTISTCEAQKNSIERQVDGGYELVLEPERRDTAPAIMLACSHLVYKQHAKEDDTVIVMPIDSLVEQTYYDAISELDKLVGRGISDLVLLGVEPTYPSEKYGYIVPGSLKDGVVEVLEFKEKPDKKTAEKLISRGGLWNCGVFAFKLSYVLNIAKKYREFNSYEELRENYFNLPKNSFDYEVVEKAKSVSVISYNGVWKDLGTWNTLTDEMAEFTSGRAIVDQDTCSNVHVINETGLPLVVSGLENSVVVATHDGILVTSKDRSAHIKPLVERASESRPMYEKRRWGEYRVLDSSVYSDGCKALTKELIIESGKQLSYQRHSHRSETWTIVSGFGEVVLGGEVTAVTPGMTITIEKKTKHAIRAFEEIHAIEVQFGDLLEESDIERFGSYWDEQTKQ